MFRRWKYFWIWVLWGLALGAGLVWRDNPWAYEGALFNSILAGVVWFLAFCFLGVLTEAGRFLWRRFKRHAG